MKIGVIDQDKVGKSAISNIKEVEDQIRIIEQQDELSLKKAESFILDQLTMATYTYKLGKYTGKGDRFTPKKKKRIKRKRTHRKKR
jgi:hypothetical protein